MARAGAKKTMAMVIAMVIAMAGMSYAQATITEMDPHMTVTITETTSQSTVTKTTELALIDAHDAMIACGILLNYLLSISSVNGCVSGPSDMSGYTMALDSTTATTISSASATTTLATTTIPSASSVSKVAKLASTSKSSTPATWTDMNAVLGTIFAQYGGATASLNPGFLFPTTMTSITTTAPSSVVSLLNEPVPSWWQASTSYPVPASVSIQSSYQHDPVWSGTRDVGSSGVINEQSIWVYGDTISLNSKGNMTGLVPNSAAFGILNEYGGETYYANLDSNNRPSQFVPFTELELLYWMANDWSGVNRPGLWVSNVVPLGDGTVGAVYYVKALAGVTVGVGVSPVFVNASGVFAERIMDVMWNTSYPQFGCLTTYVEDGYIYAFGDLNGSIYVARTFETEYWNVDTYSYWDGTDWADTFAGDGKGEIFWQVQAGTIFYSDYLGKYVFLYNDAFLDNLALMRTSDSILGPWSDDVTLYQAEQKGDQPNYCFYAHPEYFGHDSPKLLFSWSDPYVGDIRTGIITFY